DGIPDIVTGAARGGGPEVKVYDGKTGAVIMDFMAYDSRFLGGVNVAVGDVNGDGKADIITGAGFGGGPHVRIFDGATGIDIGGFMAFDASATGGAFGGVTVAVGDVTGDGQPDVVVGAGVGSRPLVRVFNPISGEMEREFEAYNLRFRGGVNVAVGDVTGDGTPDIVTGAGIGGGAHVQVFGGARPSGTRAPPGSQEVLAHGPHFPRGAIPAA